MKGRGTWRIDAKKKGRSIQREASNQGVKKGKESREQDEMQLSHEGKIRGTSPK